jgi:hypothetical protein
MIYTVKLLTFWALIIALFVLLNVLNICLTMIANIIKLLFIKVLLLNLFLIGKVIHGWSGKLLYLHRHIKLVHSLYVENRTTALLRAVSHYLPIFIYALKAVVMHTRLIPK